MWKCFKNEKVWCAIGGAVAVIAGKKILASKKTRELAVTGLAKGMKLTHDAKEAFQSMKDDAADLCYDAQVQAGINVDADESKSEEEATDR